MIKSTLFFLFVALWVITEVKSESSGKDLIDKKKIDNSRYWLISCTLSGCSFAFNSCMNCFGERGCKKCISLRRPECAVCVEDIFNKDDLETINGNKYLICDPCDPIQSKVCHLYCRGQYAISGQCVRENNLPICKCSSGSGSFTTDTTVTTQSIIPTYSTTTTQPTLSPNKHPIHFNGSVKLNITINGIFEIIFPLPNGDLVRGNYGNLIEIWDLQIGKIKRILKSVYSRTRVFGLLSNGDLVAGYRNNKTLLVWDLKITNGEPLKRIIQTNEDFTCLTVLKNDDLAIGQNGQYGKSYDIILRDSHNGLIKKVLVGHSSTVFQIVELPNGNLVSCSYDKTVKVWNISNSVVIKSIAHSDWVYSITFLPNGYLVSGLWGGIINIWNLETNQLISNLKEHTNSICWDDCLQVLANGDLLSGSWDDTIRVWDPSDGKLKFTSSLHKSRVYQLAALPNGNLISSSRTEIIVWY